MSENVNQNNAANAEMMALAQSLGKTIDELKAMDEATLRMLPPMIQQKIRQLKQGAMAPAAENQERANTESAEVARQEAGNANADSDPAQVQPVNQQQPINTEAANLADGKNGQANASHVEDGSQKAKDAPMSEIELLREALKVSEARHKTLQGKYNAEGKRQREENETLKAQLAEATAHRQESGGQTELDINDENLKALAENGWDAADIERLAKVILKKQSAVNPLAKSGASNANEPAQQTAQDQAQPPKAANHGDADVMINAHLLSSIGMSLPDFVKIPNINAHMLTIRDKNGNTAQDLYDTAMTAGNWQEAAEILAEVHTVLNGSKVIPGQPKQETGAGKQVRAVTPGSTSAGNVAIPPTKPDYAAAKRAVDKAVQDFTRNPGPETNAAMVTAQKNYENALKT